jgi:hypothetical protein
LSKDAQPELIFAVSVSSFTEGGYLGSASYGGRSVDLEFDDKDAGIFLTPEMGKRIGTKTGSNVLVVVESESEPLVVESVVAGTASKPRISSAKVYYEVGKEGGAVLRVRKA